MTHFKPHFKPREIQVIDLVDFSNMMCAELYEYLTDAISQSDRISYGNNDDTLVRPCNFVDFMETALELYTEDGDEAWLLDHQEEIDSFRVLMDAVADLEKRDVVPYIAIGS